MPERYDVDTLAERLRRGERAALSRAITLVESRRGSDAALADGLMARLPDAPPRPSSRRIGVTGSPGAGKSTLVEAYGERLLSAGHRVAVLAVDPSSNRTRGSILGDKTRMPTLSADDRAFVRPSPAGTTLGGVARATRRSIRLCEAAGYDRVLVETVGVGQSEHAVRDVCDCMALLVLPGGGDDLQGIKRGIVELADLVLVHKADGPRAELARHTARDYRNALHLRAAGPDGAWSPRVTTGSSVAEGGLASFAERLDAYFGHLGAEGLAALRREQALRSFERDWPERVVEVLRTREAFGRALARTRADLSAGALDEDAALRILTDIIANAPLAP